jgi:hypothetical protein
MMSVAYRRVMSSQALDQVDAMWHDVEPAIRDWVAEGDTLTEQDWHEGFKRILAEYGAGVRQKDDAGA